MPLAFKPDAEEAAKRWEAFFAGEMIDRPVVCAAAPKKGSKQPRPPELTYHDRVFRDIDEILDRALRLGEDTFYGGEAFPSFCPSFGPDEIAAFAGGRLEWSNESGNTNWSKPFVEDWSKALPLKIREDNPLWQRLMKLMRRAAERLEGKMLITPIDLHSNMDLLAAIRGPQRLCLDLMDHPEMIEEAMKSSRAIFPKLWDDLSKAGKMRERGYYQHCFSMEGAAMLQCDFICMMSPEMCNRFVMPALEEEAAIVKRVYFHWDGPDALRHTPAVLASKGLYLLSYVTGAGHGSHLDHLDMLKNLQAHGKAVAVGGTPEQLKIMHRHLKPDKVVYQANLMTQTEAEELLEWFVKNT
jgi:hypothetical protein